MEHPNDLHPVSIEAVKDEVVVETGDSPVPKPLNLSRTKSNAGTYRRIFAQEMICVPGCLLEAKRYIETDVFGIKVRRFVGIGVGSGKNSQKLQSRFFFLCRFVSSCFFLSQ
jgi:hypothetical protein